MTKKQLIDELWEKNLASVDDATVVVDYVWNALHLPLKGSLIRVNGDMDSKLTIGEGNAKATVLILSSDDNVVKLNHLKDSPVVVFGVEVEEEPKAPSGPTEIELLAAESAAEEAEEEESEGDDEDTDDEGDEETEEAEEAEDEEEEQPEPEKPARRGRRS